MLQSLHRWFVHLLVAPANAPRDRAPPVRFWGTRVLNSDICQAKCSQSRLNTRNKARAERSIGGQFWKEENQAKAVETARDAIAPLRHLFGRKQPAAHRTGQRPNRVLFATHLMERGGANLQSLVAPRASWRFLRCLYHLTDLCCFLPREDGWRIVRQHFRWSTFRDSI